MYPKGGNTVSWGTNNRVAVVTSSTIGMLLCLLKEGRFPGLMLMNDIFFFSNKRSSR